MLDNYVINKSVFNATNSAFDFYIVTFHHKEELS